MELVIIALLVILTVVAVIILVRILGRDQLDVASKIDASLKDAFLTFQSDIYKQIDSARQDINRSKDVMSEHAIKTIDTVRQIGSTIEKIVQQQEEAQKLGQSLKDVLQAPKLRGNYGEVILEEMLERVLPVGIWERQYDLSEGRKVDAVIKIKDVIVPIDAKFPRDSYNKYLEAQDESAKSAFWKEHVNSVKIQIRSINSKYIDPEKGTTDFALMFIPSETVYYETIAQKNYLGEPSELYEFSQKNKVIPVSPNTFYAFLQVVIIGIRNLEIIKSAKKLQEELSSLQKSFGHFYKKYEDIGKHLEKAYDSYRVGDNHIVKYKEKLSRAVNREELLDGKDRTEES